MDGFQLILIGDAHDLPMIDVKAGKFSAKVNDWSSDVRPHLHTSLTDPLQLKASIGIMPFVNYFNLRVSHWEPLMDPWEFAVHVRPFSLRS